MFHWCADETLMLMTAIPFVGMYFRRIHAWWHNKFSHKCHEKTCEEKHVEHPKKPKRKVYQPKEPIKHLTSEDCERIAKEAERYREEIGKRLDRLDHITPEDLKIRVRCHEYSPFDREDYHKVSEEDMKYLRGTPAPLKIIVPNIVIEENDEDENSR